MLNNNMSDSRHVGRQRSWQTTGLLGEKGFMAPFFARREGKDDGDDMHAGLYCKVETLTAK